MAKILALLISAAAGLAADQASTPGAERWPLWEAYADQFISAEGRVIDYLPEKHRESGLSTSEGQAYGLFFALVADDRARFDLLLSWTENNLAQGDLGATLPAWKWGRTEDGDFAVIDDNAASDADMWIVYALLEAARLWCEPRYEQLARRLSAQIVEHELVELPKLGPMVLPGPTGFVLDEHTWRLNPSYLPIFKLRRFVSAELPGPWRGVLNSALVVNRESARGGFVPDWIAYRESEGFIPCPKKGSLGSYDAIRSYLWPALTSDDDPTKEALLKQVSGLFRYWNETGRIPERIDTAEGAPLPGDAPPGFFLALLPTVQQLGTRHQYDSLKNALDGMKHGDLYGAAPKYYDQNLAMFAIGFTEKRFRFSADGRLKPRWSKRCSSP